MKKGARYTAPTEEIAQTKRSPYGPNRSPTGDLLGRQKIKKKVPFDS